MGGSRIPKIIQKAGEEFIEQQIKARPDIICKELQTMYINHFNQLVSEDTIRRCVKKLGYVKKSMYSFTENQGTESSSKKSRIRK